VSSPLSSCEGWLAKKISRKQLTFNRLAVTIKL
jgi:hypothetical protein